MKERFIDDCSCIRQQSPIIYNITNSVAANFSANALLAIGASPLMSSEPEDARELMDSAAALVVNIGSLEQSQAEAMARAASAAHAQGKPWVLDPAGVGLSCFRKFTADTIIKEFHPALIRGNASEIMTLAGARVVSKGVDSAISTEDAVECAVRLARESGAVVAVSGAVDYITDGMEIACISNGSPLMSRVTAMGCTASAIAAAFLAVEDSAFYAAANAMALMGIAGERAAAICKGTGTFAMHFIDNLYNLDFANASESIRYEKRTA